MRQLQPSGTVLDEANAVSLLLYLLEHEGDKNPIMATNLLDVVKNYNRIKALAEQFKDLGLVNVDVIKDRNIMFSYSLTEKGREVALALRHAVDLISAT